MKLSFTDYSSWTFWRLLTLLTVLTAGGASAQISGTVFRDFNASGAYEAIPASGTYAYGEATVAGITVTAYNAANAVVATTTTSSAGTYTLTTASGIVNGTAYRIEFTGVATGDFTGPLGASNGSSVQFVTAGASTTANFGINYPTDYCQANPPIATACYVFGNQVAGANSADPVFITFPFDAGSRAVLINEGVTPVNGAYDQPTAHPIMTDASQVGTTFGIAYARGTRTFYAAAYFKKHAGFGPGGPGAIYRIDGTTGVVSGSFAVPNATLNRHDVTNYQIDNGNIAWDAVGKTSLGGMDLSDDEQTLYVMNLENRNLYALNATTGTVTANQPMTAVTGCPVGDVRPFAVEFRRGTLYVGIVCTAESSSLVTGNLRGYVYTVNPTTLALSGTPVFQFPLTYPRGKAAGTGPANWLPWRPIYTNISTSANTPATSNRIVYPMPMLTNLDFDVNNDLIIGLRDRLGDIAGHNTFDNPNNAALATQGRIAGDMLRAASTGVNSWTLESNGRVGGRGTSRQGTNQGPGGAEFYQGDSYPLSSSVTGTATYAITSVTPTYNYTITTGASTVGPGQITLANGIQGFGENHDETSLGTVLQLPGQGEVMALVYDPVPDNNDDGFFDGGVRRMSNVTGSWTQSYRIYKGESTSTEDFGKAAGLSEPVAQCNPAPIEIGNRVWNDVNNNGIQDANETSYAVVAGLTVQLLQGGTVISTTTVSATGTYLFSSASTTAIQPNTAYQIRLVLPDNTRAISSTSAAGTNRAVDSDASSAGIISLTTEDYGENNHTYDIGVFACTLPTGTISATAATCLNNAPTANGRVAVTGITNGAQANISQGTSYTGVGFGGTGNVAVAGGAVSFTGLTGGRTYTVRVFSGTATCSQDFTIAVPQTVCCTLAFADVIAGPCSTTTNQFTTTGRVTLGGAVAGNLVVSNGAQTVTIPVTSATTSVTFALVDESDGTTQTISASLAGCGSITTSVVSPVACFTVCPSSCNLLGITRYATTAEANAEFSYQTLAAEARYGNGSTNTASYELDFNRVSPAFATLTTGQYNWTSGTPNSFTLAYDPALPGQNRAVFTLQAGAQRVSIQTNPQAPTTGTPLPVQFNAIQLSLQASDLITASAQVSNLALNGSSLGPTTLAATSLATLRDSDDIIIRSSQRGQAFVLTGTLTFNWLFATPPSENGLSLNIRLGTVNDCAASPITTVNSATIACQATSTTLTAISNQTGLTYQWTGPAGFTANTQSVTVTAPGTYTVVSTNPDTGCASTTTTATVTRAPAVTATISASPGNTVCQGTSVTLTANASGGTGFTYAWSPAGTGATQSVTVSPALTTVYTVTVTNSNLCLTTATATVTVNPAVTAVITTSPGSTICQGASVTLTASGGTAYRWSTGAITAVISVTPALTTPYSVTVTNAMGCTALASTTVTVGPAVTATVNSATLTCQAPVATLTVTSSQTGLTYRWSGPGGFTATTQSVTVATPGTYTVVTTNAQTGCSSGTTATVSQVAGLAITLFTQSSCLNNGTEGTATDDYFTVTVQATNATPGAAGRYEVVLGADANGLGGIVLNPGAPSGTPYGTPVTVGGVGQPNARGFLANGSSIYSLTVRDTNNTSASSGCRSTRLTGQVNPCSSCLPPLCQPARLQRL